MNRLTIVLLTTTLFAIPIHAMEDVTKKARRDLGGALCEAVRTTKGLGYVRLLIENDADVNYSNDDGFTPLMYAAHYVALETCEVLIAAGADLYPMGWSPLSLAAKSAFTDRQITCELLVEKMLSTPDAKQKEGIYAFLLCLKRMHPRQWHNLCDVFKVPLRAMIKEENNDAVFVRVQGIKREPLKEHLLRKYFSNQGKVKQNENN